MSEYARRRKAFVDSMGDAVAVFPSAPEQPRSADGDYPYRQDSDFYYLTGFEEPNSALVLAPGNADAKSIAFVQPRNREREVWEGRRLGPDAAAAALGVDQAYPIDDLWDRLPKLLETSDNLYYPIEHNPAFDDRIVELVRELRGKRQRQDRAAINLLDPNRIIHEMRAIKTAYDVERLRRAVNVSVEGHLAAMRQARPGMHEYEIQAIIEYVFTSRGAQTPAYSTIVGSGENACCLHYCANRRRVADGDLVLVDAGAEVDFYCGDITRTWPISGKFSGPQRAIYDIVLAANERIIQLCKPGVKWSSEIHEATVEVLVAGLIDVGLLSGSAAEHIEKETYKQFYMHRQGHYLGLDVHDVGDYRKDGDWRGLEAGMVLTVEPGLYIAQDAEVDARFRGIGVRIEDDVLITPTGCDVLSLHCPKTIEDIEKTMASRRAAKEPTPA